MTCPRDKHGKLLCEIIDHPDRNDQSFCNYCKRRFKKDESWDFDAVWGVICVLFMLLFVLMLVGCEKPAKSVNEPLSYFSTILVKRK